jgi:phage terminase large subunit GpA-like protein
MIDSDAIDSACAVLEPPPVARSVYEFACDIVLSGGGPLDGSRLNPRAERAIELWLEVLSSRQYQWHTLIAPSQRSKTLSGVIVPTLHALIERRVNAGWFMPNLDKLGQKWTGDIQPTIEAGGFGAYLPTKGPASRGGRPAVLRVSDPATGKRLSNLYAMALGKGGSETASSSNPCVWVTIDEADDAENAGQLRLAQKRVAAYGAAGGGVITSTVNARIGRDTHPILEVFEDTTKTRLAHLCPHCHEFVIPDLENFLVDRAAIVCPACSVVWSDSDRHAARNAAVYRHGNPLAKEFGVLYTVLDYFWEYPDKSTGKVTHVLDQLASEHRSALAAKDRGDPSQWNTYLRKQWCRPEPNEDAEVPATIDLEQAARATKSEYTRGEIPVGSSVISIGADTGKRDGWELTLSMSADLSWHIIDWGHRTTPDPKVEPTPNDQRAMLDALRERMVRVGRADIIGIDVGYNTDLVVPWAKSHGIKLMRGDSRPYGKKDENDNKHLPSWAESRRQEDGSTWIFVDVGIVKTEIAKSLARDPNTPGAGHLPLGQEAGDWLIRHITAEVWDSKHQTWVKRPGRDNHLLDCLVYAWALARIKLLAFSTKQPPRKYGAIKAL